MEKSYEEQIQEYNEILKSNPNDLEILKKLANILNSIGKREEAIHEYEKYLKLNPNSIELLYLFGSFLAYIIKNKEKSLKI